MEVKNIIMVDDVVEINQELEQGVSVHVRLVNKRELCVEKKWSSTKIKYTIDILALSDASKQVLLLGWMWFSVGIIMLLLMVVCLKYLPIVDSSIFYMAAVYIVGLGVSAGCFGMAWKGTSRKKIFYSRNANIPLIELTINKPSEIIFNNFIDKVEKCIQSTREELVISMNNQLIGEMKMLRRLHEKNVLKESVYKKAKAGLLSKH